MTPLLSLGILKNLKHHPTIKYFFIKLFVYFYNFPDFYNFLTGEESLKFGGVNFQRTESGRFINKNGQELSNDAMAASKFLLSFINSNQKRIKQKYIQNFINKKFRKQFHFLTCILPDYVSHESLNFF
jgi:hypothetical protein